MLIGRELDVESGRELEPENGRDTAPMAVPGRVLAALIELELGTGDPVAAARRAGADGVGVPYQILDLNTVEGADSAGILVQAWVINGEVALDRYCEWPLHSLITDYPQRAPCL